MKGLNRPSWDATEDFDAIVAVKRDPRAKAALLEARSAVNSSSSRYRACVPQLETFQGEPINPTQKTALLDCYAAKRRTNPCKAMLARIRKLSPSAKCPLCGLNDARTFDHYLPESLFPELAVCAYNLVPACYKCNNARGTRWHDAHGRSILHLYYDWIPPHAQILEADVQIESNKPKAYFRIEAEPTDPGFEGHFARHCHTLGLLDLFDQHGRDKLIDIVDDLQGRGYDPRSVAIELQTTAHRRASRHGANQWEAALYRAAARSKDFIHYALTGGTV